MSRRKLTSTVADGQDAPSPAELEARASALELRTVEGVIDKAEAFVRESLEEEGKYPRDVGEGRNGLPEAAVSIALWRMINGGEVELGPDRIARLIEQPSQNGGTAAENTRKPS